MQAEAEGGSDCPTCPSRDLLGQEPQEKLEIRLCPDGSGQLYVPGLTEFQVQSVDDINKVWGWETWGQGNLGTSCPRAELLWSRSQQADAGSAMSPCLSDPVFSSAQCRG